MASVNKVIIIGRVGGDPMERNGVVNISVATFESWNDKQTGEKKELTEWHRVSFFGKLAEIAGQYLKKGSQVYIEGHLRTRKYTDKKGIERFATEIIADTMQMLGTRQDGQQQTSSRPTQNSYDQARNGNATRPLSDMDSDIPF